MTYELSAWYEPFLVTCIITLKLFEGQMGEMWMVWMMKVDDVDGWWNSVEWGKEKPGAKMWE